MSLDKKRFSRNKGLLRAAYNSAHLHEQQLVTFQNQTKYAGKSLHTRSDTTAVRNIMAQKPLPINKPINKRLKITD